MNKILPCDVNRRFGGLERLYGKGALDILAQANIGIIGVGGVGSWTVESLARSGIGRMTLIDMDHIAESNINRQLPALDSTLGQAKTAALSARVKDINPDCRVEPLDEFLSIENLSTLITPAFDFVIDCIDDFRIKSALIAYCRDRNIKLLTTGGAGGKSDPARIRLTDLAKSEQDPLLAKTRSLLRQSYGFPRNPKKNFKIACVWSDEPLLYPREEGNLSFQRPQRGGNRLNCGGLGSMMAVTASFGLAASAHVLNALLDQNRQLALNNAKAGIF